MHNNVRATAAKGATRMPTNHRAAAIVGLLFILATVTAIFGLIFYGPILTGPDFLVNGAAKGNQVVLGVIMELILAGTAIGTTVGLFPFLRKHNESLALGYLSFRLLEAILISVGIVCVLALLTLSRQFAAAAAPEVAAYQTVGKALIAAKDWTFILGPHLMLGINTLMYSALLYKSQLVPRPLAGLGLIGAVLILIAALLEICGVIGAASAWVGILAMPIAFYEMILAVRLIVKGFNAPAIAPQAAPTLKSELLPAG